MRLAYIAFASIVSSMPPTATAGPDYRCMDDCAARRYSHAYCLQVCEVRSTQPAPQPASPFESFLEGQRARQESEQREAEIDRARAEAASSSARSQSEKDQERIWAEAAKEWAAEQEKARLQAENEALKKRVEELERQAAKESSSAAPKK